MKLSIIIVSYNTISLLKRCLETVYQALDFADLARQGEVIVVDNASVDDSCNMVRKNYSKVYLIRNKRNLGFAKANNQALRHAQGEYVLLLNSDTEVNNDTFSKLISKLEEDPKIGAVGPKLLNKDGTLQQSIGYFPSIMKVFFWMSFIDDLPYLSSILKPYHMQNQNFYKNENEVDWVSGACILVRREAIGKVGLLDEKIFMYGEEVEWCYRIKKEGFRVLYTPATNICHLKGASGEGVKAGIVEEFESLIYFYRKHKSMLEQLILRILLMFGALFRLILFGIIAKDKTKTKLYAQAFWLARR